MVSSDDIVTSSAQASTTSISSIATLIPLCSWFVYIVHESGDLNDCTMLDFVPLMDEALLKMHLTDAS